MNGIRIPFRIPQKLKDGDVIGIGRGRDLRDGDRIAEKNLEVNLTLMLCFHVCK